jgi:hypothetical protein
MSRRKKSRFSLLRNGNPISQRKSHCRHPTYGVSTSLLHPPLPALQPPIALPIFSREAVSERPIIRAPLHLLLRFWL